MRTAIYLFYGLVVEIRPKSGVPHYPPELFIHLGGAIGTKRVPRLSTQPKRDLGMGQIRARVFAEASGQGLNGWVKSD